MEAMVAAADWEALAGIFVGFGMVVVVPLIWLLLAHQRKMAEMFHGRASTDAALQERVNKLEHELRELRGRLDDQIIRADDRERQLQERIKKQDTLS